MKSLVLTNKQLPAIQRTLIEGMSVAVGAKSSATYYHGRDEQMTAIKKTVEGMYGLSKELPLILANQKGATGKFIQEVLLNEFKHTSIGGSCNIVNPIDWYDNGLSDKAILNSLFNLNEDSGIPYVLRLFVDLKNEKVNNERSRKIMLSFILGNSNLEFNALKYRNKMAKILKHIYGVKITSVLIAIAKKQLITNGIYQNEKEQKIANDYLLKYYNGDSRKAFKIFLFIMKQNEGIPYLASEFPLLYEYFIAKGDITKATKVPEEVLIGLISNKTHPQYTSMWSDKLKREATKAMLRKNVEVTSINQQVRQTKSTAKLGVTKTVDLEKATDFLALYKTGYENSFTEELKTAIDKLAEKKKITNFSYRNIGIVLDKSNSMSGNKIESKNTPKAIAHFTSMVLAKSAGTYSVVETEEEVTDLATAFVKLLKNENPSKPYEAIFMITDGYENAYEGMTNEVISIFKNETGRSLPIFQISPITSAEMNAKVRTLGDSVTTLAVNSPVAIQPQISARLLEIDAKQWLENQVHILEESTVSRVVKHNINA